MAGQLTIDTLKASSGVLATQNGMTGIAKAWVNFNGSTGSINGSFNVGSITKNGTGDYTVNFITAMPSANYAAFASAGNDSTGSAIVYNTFYGTAHSSSLFRFVTTNSAFANSDYSVTTAAVFGA